MLLFDPGLTKPDEIIKTDERRARMSETTRRRESAGSEALGLTEALARIRADRGRAENAPQEVEGRRRLGALAAFSRDGGRGVGS